MTSLASAVSSSSEIQWKRIEGAKDYQFQWQATITPKIARSIFSVELMEDAQLFSDKRVTDLVKIKSVLGLHRELERALTVNKNTFLAYQKGEKTEEAHSRTLASAIFVNNFKTQVQEKAGLSTNLACYTTLQSPIAAILTAKERLYYFQNSHTLGFMEIRQLIRSHKGITQEERETLIKNKDEGSRLSRLKRLLDETPTIDAKDLPQ